MSVIEEKKRMRATVRARVKDALATRYADRDALARVFATQLFTIPEVASAKTVMAYIDLPDEVPVSKLMTDLFFRLGRSETLSAVAVRQVVVPYCQGNELGLFRFSVPEFPCATQTLLTNELASGQYHILEPRSTLRSDPQHAVDPSQIDIVLVPGIAFDLQGGRLGRGAGYYDRFVSRLSNNTLLISLVLDEQLVESVPMEIHDRHIDYIVKTGIVHKIR
ncbi:MAG: 5-formyltetrahydrofolate cyclo-ligase [Planctomycetia bacterium]|nr:5-formyltetrahydrofolate cyclo-ligase [Planctomycetia bacterium]